MRDSHGCVLMPIWKIKPYDTTFIIAAWTRNDAYAFMKENTNYLWSDNRPKDFTRCKGCFAKLNDTKILSA